MAPVLETGEAFGGDFTRFFPVGGTFRASMTPEADLSEELEDTELFRFLRLPPWDNWW